MCTVHILDDDHSELPVGEIGTSGSTRPAATFEYHNDPEKTAEASQPEGWYDRRRHGLRRRRGLPLPHRSPDVHDHLGGVNIYPQEAENVLIMHPEVADAAVFGIPDPDLGEQVKGVVQLLDWSDAGPELETELLAFCREHLADYKCPRAIDFDRRAPPPGHRQALQAPAQGPLLGRPHLADRVRTSHRERPRPELSRRTRPRRAS